MPKLIEFPGHNAVIGKNQPEYQPLPAMLIPSADGKVHFCWQFSWRERIKLLLTGKLWHSVLTFNHPFQPVMIAVDVPEEVKSASENNRA